MQRFYQHCIHLQARFAAGEHAHLTALVRQVVQRQHLGYDLFRTHLSVLRELGVAPRTTQVTAAEANKHSGNPTVRTFALKRIEYFVNFIHD